VANLEFQIRGVHLRISTYETDADQRLEQDPHPGLEKTLLLSHHQGQFCEAIIQFGGYFREVLALLDTLASLLAKAF